jgi:O-antigen/teichoic acid export membrane protein
VRKLYKATVVMGAATFVAMIAGLVRAKFLAVTLGPVGVGIFSQALTFFQSAETICGLGIGLGITKYAALAFSKKDYSGLKGVVSAFVVLQSVSFAALFFIVLLFSGQISQFLFSSTRFSNLLIVVMGGVLFSSILISFESVMLGMGRPDTFSKSRILYNLIGLALFVCLVYTMKLAGAFWYILVNSMISISVVAVFLAYLLKAETGKGISEMIGRLKGLQLRHYAGKLISYGVVMLVTSAVTWLSMLYVRSLLIRNLGAAANGFFQVIFALVGAYAPFFTNSVWGYLFPKLSAVERMSDFNFEVNMALRFIILFVTPSIAVLFLCGKMLVLLVFSEEFLAGLGIFPLYLLGSLFYMIAYIFSSGLLAKKELKAYTAVIILQNALYIFVFARLVTSLGLSAVAVSYCAMNVFACVTCVLYQTRRRGLRLSAGNITLFTLSLVFVCAVFFIPFGGAWAYAAKWVMVAVWLVFAVGKREKALLFSFMRRGQ